MEGEGWKTDTLLHPDLPAFTPSPSSTVVGTGFGVLTSEQLQFAGSLASPEAS
jgi:hypothetical protein